MLPVTNEHLSSVHILMESSAVGGSGSPWTLDLEQFSG